MSDAVLTAMVAGAVSVMVLVLGKLLDWHFGRRRAADQAALMALSPKTEESWREGYFDISAQFRAQQQAMEAMRSQFEGEIAELRRNFDALTSAVREEPWEVGQRIFTRARGVASALSNKPIRSKGEM